MADDTVNALLVIADIGGYTRFMNLHRMSLAHAQENTLRLLDAVIDAAPDLELSGLEGDAAFLYATDPSASEITRSLAGLATAMHRAFHHEQAHMEQLRVCWCDGCVQTGKLTVKIVAHYGEAVLSATRGHATLTGVDVILVHRMLKNSVPVIEYVLMTDPVAECLDESTRGLCKPLIHDFDGLGNTSTHYIDLATSEVTPLVPERGFFGRLSKTTKFELSTLPFLLGFKKPAEGFRNLGRGAEEIPA